MKKNTASQKIGAQMVSATDGSAFTGSVTVYVTGDAGTQAVGSVGAGACTSEGNGYHTYAPAQAETNYNLVAFTFTGTGAVPATIQIETESIDRHDTVRMGLTAMPNAAADAAGGLPISDAGGLDLDNRMPAAAAVTNLNVVYNTDFLTNYDTTFDCWVTRISDGTGVGQLDTALGEVIVGSIHAGAIDATALASSAVAEIWTTAMTESYAADGAAPTPAQSLFLIQQVLTEFSISSTTLTAKKLDGSTTAGTFTLNDATSPTGITRTS